MLKYSKQLSPQSKVCKKDFSVQIAYKTLFTFFHSCDQGYPNSFCVILSELSFSSTSTNYETSASLLKS